MIRAFGILALAVLLIGAAAASDPVKITSDLFTVDETTHLATFTGKVVATRSDMTLWADKLVVEYAYEGPSSIKSFTATGNVKVKSKDQTANSDKAVYDPKTQLLRLTGNVIISDGKGSIASPDVTINLKTNNSVFTSTGGGRVTGVFTTPNK